MTRENHGPSELIAYRYNPTRLVNGLQDETCRHFERYGNGNVGHAQRRRDREDAGRHRVRGTGSSNRGLSRHGTEQRIHQQRGHGWS